ncbi:phage tail protein [Thiopseudomonas alkaliphila]|nr:phage tail protein [Thiopseudomonas alkaliphila]
METVRALQGDTIDLICWRHYGRTAGVVEQVLDSNRGLAELGPVLPIGTPVKMPVEPEPAQTAQVIQLWD